MIHEVVLDPDELEQFKQDYLVVREIGQFARVLAAVEVLSPANKSGTYVPRYREKRLHWLASRAHFMEIDFLRDGENPSRQLFPELPPTPYFILVARKTGLGRNEEGYPLHAGPAARGRPSARSAAARFAARSGGRLCRGLRPEHPTGQRQLRARDAAPAALDAADAAWVRSVAMAGKTR